MSLNKEENCIRWQRIERIIRNEFKRFDGLKVIEIGAGAGTNAALMASRGAEVTMLDYSTKALERSRIFFERNRLSARHVAQDALALDSTLIGKFDVSMSFGLAEHFIGGKRWKIIKSHFDLVRPGGLAIIAVPNKWNPPYRIYKAIAEILGIWTLGEEYPFSRGEMADICRQLDKIKYSFLGDSFYSSFVFVNPMRIYRKLTKTRPRLRMEKIKQEKGSWLDQYVSYSLVLCVKI